MACVQPVRLRAALLLVATSLVPWWAEAQEARYELGLRLRRFEAAWERADEQQRAAAVGPVERAVEAFFSMRLAAAAAAIDDAWFAVRGSEPPGAHERVAAAHSLRLDARIDALQAATLRARIVPFYDCPVAPPDHAQVQFELVDAAGQSRWEGLYSWTGGCTGVECPVGDLPAGDWQLRGRLQTPAGEYPLLPVPYARIAELEPRLRALEQAVLSEEGRGTATARSTLATNVRLLRRMQRNEVLETAYPAARLLADSEALRAAAAQPAAWFAAAARSADLWTTLCRQGKRVPVRLRASQSAADRWPVVFLFHGAGGSENMFFEAYGAGAAVAACQQRGWLAVAPRQGFLGMELDCDGMLSALEELFPIDRTRVFLLGHSMGAAQAVRQAQLHPDVPAAVAVVGGGGAVVAGRDVARFPWWIAAGERDFGRRGAERLAGSLQSAGAEVTYREIPRVEHLVVVQAALPEAFAFFDAQSTARRTAP